MISQDNRHAIRIIQQWKTAAWLASHQDTVGVDEGSYYVHVQTSQMETAGLVLSKLCWFSSLVPRPSFSILRKLRNWEWPGEQATGSASIIIFNSKVLAAQVL